MSKGTSLEDVHVDLQYYTTLMTKVQILEESVSLDTFDDSKLPTDVHIVCFTKDGKKQYDAVRAYTKVDIFDEYYDKLGKTNPIHSIKSGYGKVKPIMYGKIKPSEN